ncbi:polypeptide N-acetylgalactosaminyltransferase 2 [Striga asiatica]|uniref:Polypeptide N-acetylgalactosaminyltransferase 2 n=1 Tax=Striga asiatica TaxID=4170 RepID=A0A5A7R7H8_STRAF|nr:polypeptide N-acetylgalactosaminyltransferase 2 [Striga asiatica]
MWNDEDFVPDPDDGALLEALRVISSSSRPGLDSSTSSTHVSPLSILATADIVGRFLGLSWVHNSPIFTNLKASSVLKSPLSDLSIKSIGLASNCILRSQITTAKE